MPPNWNDLLPSDKGVRRVDQLLLFHGTFDEADTLCFQELMPQVGSHVSVILDRCRFHGDVDREYESRHLGSGEVIAKLLSESSIENLELHSQSREGIKQWMEKLVSERTLCTNDKKSPMLLLPCSWNLLFPSEVYLHLPRLTHLSRLEIIFMERNINSEAGPFLAALKRNGSLHDVAIILYQRSLSVWKQERLDAYCTRNKLVPKMLEASLLATTKKTETNNAHAHQPTNESTETLVPTLLVVVQQAPALAPNRILKAFVAWNPTLPPPLSELKRDTQQA